MLTFTRPNLINKQIHIFSLGLPRSCRSPQWFFDHCLIGALPEPCWTLSVSNLSTSDLNLAISSPSLIALKVGNSVFYVSDDSDKQNPTLVFFDHCLQNCNLNIKIKLQFHLKTKSYLRTGDDFQKLINTVN